MVDFVRRVAVPVVTARKLFDVGSYEHLRMALIVLDGAAEMLLRKNVSEHSFLISSADRMYLEHHKSISEGDVGSLPLFPVTFPIGPDQDVLPLTRLPHLSNGQKRKLEDNFDPNADMAVIYGTIDQQSAQILRDAHHFRNIAYHQDTADRPSLESTVTLQIAAVAKLLKSVKPMVQRGIYDDQAAVLRTELGLSDTVSLTLEGLGDFLIQDIELELSGATGAYSASISRRVAWVNRATQRIAEELTPEPGVLSATDALRLCQLEEPWPSLEECRLLPVTVERALIQAWEAESLLIARLREPPEALRRFRAVDKPLRALEGAVRAVVNQINVRSIWQ